VQRGFLASAPGKQKPLQIPFHLFAVFIADAGAIENLLETRHQASVGIADLWPGPNLLFGLGTCLIFVHVALEWRPQGDSNPCYRRERAVS
jgi:hypothetical protein